MCSARVRQVLYSSKMKARLANTSAIAEFRGPGVRHQFDDSPDDFDLDLDHRARGFGGKSGRIILLGDGTEVLTDADDADMFDHSEEDKDLESQVRKGAPSSDEAAARSKREGTPAPERTSQDTTATTPSRTTMTESPSSTNTEHSELSTKPGGNGSPEETKEQKAEA